MAHLDGGLEMMKIEYSIMLNDPDGNWIWVVILEECDFIIFKI